MTEFHTNNGALIDDQRQHVAFPVCYVVCTDKFMSGWGLARGGRSLMAFAVPGDHLYGGMRPADIEQHIISIIHGRSEMIRPRTVYGKRKFGINGLPTIKLYAGDHLSVRDWSTAGAFYPAMPKAVV